MTASVLSILSHPFMRFSLYNGGSTVAAFDSCVSERAVGNLFALSSSVPEAIAPKLLSTLASVASFLLAENLLPTYALFSDNWNSGYIRPRTLF